MAQEYTELVDVLPTQSLKTVLDFVRGNNPGSKPLVLAAVNVQSYAASQFLPDGKEPIFAAAMHSGSAPTRQEAEAAILAVLPDEQGTMKAGIGLATWIVIAKTVVPIILNLLK